MTAPLGGVVLGRFSPSSASLDDVPITPDPDPGPGPAPTPPPSNTRTIRWTGRDDEGNTVTGSLPVTVNPRPGLCPITPADTDQTADLIAWVKSLPAGTPADFGSAQGRVYRIDRSLALTLPAVTLVNASFRVGAPSVEIDSQGRSLRRHIWLTKCGQVQVRNVTVKGQNTTNELGQPVDVNGAATYDPKREWDHGLAVEDCPDVTVDGFTSDATFGDGMYFRRTKGSATNFVISRNGRQGVACLANMSLTHGRVVNSRRSGVDLEPNVQAETYENIELGWLDITSHLLAVTSGGPGIVQDVWVHDITAHSPSTPQISLRPNPGGVRRRWTVERFTSTPPEPLGSPLAAIECRDVADLTFRDVTIPVNPARAMTGINLVRPAGRITLERVRFPGAARLTTVDTPAAGYTLSALDCSPAT